MTRGRARQIALFAAVLVALPSVALAGGSAGDPVASVALHLALILVAAKLAGDVAVRFGQPAVLGELVGGVVLGNLGVLGVHALEPMKTDASLDLLARLGVLLLLFEVGLESTVGEMLSVGVSSLLVATVGVLVPFGLGYAVGAWLVPSAGIYAHAFMGATLAATSVGITARVLRDLGRTKTKEARIILGAAVIDDVFGLVLLAVVTGLVGASNQGGTLSAPSIVAIVAKAAVFLVGALVVGRYASPRLFRAASRLQSSAVLVCVALAFCFGFAWLADRIGLAAIVGAFAAGLVLEDVHYQGYPRLGAQPIEALVQPIAALLVPVFFVLMGMRTDLASLAHGPVLLLALGLTIVAITGKVVSGLGVLGGGVDRLAVGLGMIPRGEVGLIFANVGLGLSFQGAPLFDQGTFSAIVVMIIVTTLLTPPALAWRFRKPR